MIYRPEIDGLRTIAVVSVLIYHAQFVIGNTPVFSGGYLGVDVFFVISGYLITSILLSEMGNARFSYAKFYERRGRRILPILLVVMLCCCIAAWLTMLPKAINEFSGSLISSLLFSSNIWFWLQDSYTAEASELSPLLHTWSLSIEEQFYLVFPALLLFVRRLGDHALIRFMSLAFILSFALAQYSSTRYVDANFYLAHTRAWELLAGAILAKFSLDGMRPAQHKTIGAVFPILGLLLILVPMITYHDNWPHPSLLTLIPVTGTMILIWYLPQPGLTQKLLSSRIFTSIGLISYSLYLWHFPIFAFAKITKVDQLTTVEKWICLAASLALSIIGYLLIEKPARNRKLLSTKVFLLLTTMVIAILLGFASTVLLTDGAPHRLGAIKSIFDGAWQKDSFIFQDGERCEQRAIDPAVLCYFPSSNKDNIATKTLINVGDSHADVMGNQLLALAKDRNWNYQHITMSGCPYVEGTYRFKTGPEKSRCDAAQMDRIKGILEHSPQSIIVYSARLPGYLSGKPFDNKEGGKELQMENRKLRTDPDGRYPSQTVDQLIQLTINNMLDYGHTVVLIYPVPEVGWGLPKLIKSRLTRVPNIPLGNRLKAFESMSITTSYDVYKQRSKHAFAIYDAIPDHPNLIRIHPDQTFCSEATGRCLTHDKTKLFYYDNSHLSQNGTKLIADLIALRFFFD